MPEWDGKTPRVNLGEASPAHGEGSHNYRFGQHPVMPWHMVECPKCDGKGFVTVMEWDENGDGKPESDMVGKCDFCEGSGQVKEFEKRAYLRNQMQE